MATELPITPNFQMEFFVPGTLLEFMYDNHEGKVEQRRVLFESLGYGFNEWYPTHQFFINGLCHSTDPSAGKRRSFAINNILTGIRKA